MTADRDRAPVQGEWATEKPAGTITWAEHLEVYAKYAERWPGSARTQSAERLAERGGFGFCEAEELLGRPLKTWEPRR